MSNLNSMLERNKDFAARRSAANPLPPSLPQAMPDVKAVIIGCADMRVDPADILGLELGEAVVIRNIGGRIVPGLIEELGLLGRIGQVAGKVPGGGGEFHIIVLITPIAASLASRAIPPCSLTIFKYRKGNLQPKQSSIPASRLPSMLLYSGRFLRCRALGLFPGSSTT